LARRTSGSSGSSRSVDMRSGSFSTTGTLRAFIPGLYSTSWAATASGTGPGISSASRRRASPEPRAEADPRDDRTQSRRAPRKGHARAADRFRLRAGAARREKGSGPRRFRLRRAALRPDERRDVVRPPPLVEGVHDRTDGLEARRLRARRRGRQRRSRARSRAASRSDGARARHGYQPPDARARPRPLARPRHRRQRRLRPGRRGSAAVPRPHFPRRDDRLRLEKRDRRACGAQGEVPRAEARRPAARARVLAAALGPARAALRRVLFPGPASDGAAHRPRCRELSLSRRVDPPASGPGNAEAHDGTSRFRARELPQPVGRHRRVAYRLSAIAMRLPLSAAAERLLERAVRESSSVERKLEALEGRSFRVRVEGVGLDLTLRAEGGRVRVIENDAAPSDVTVRGTPLDLLRLVRQRNIASRLHGSGVELTGRVHVAEQFAEVLKLALPDLEEEAARFVGDIPAHRAGQAARAFVAWLKRSGRAFELNTA